MHCTTVVLLIRLLEIVDGCVAKFTSLNLWSKRLIFPIQVLVNHCQFWCLVSKLSWRPSKGFWGTGKKGHLFQGNRGTKAKF